MTFWLRSGWFQKSGEAISFSVLSKMVRLEGASKIAPHSFCLLAERFVLSLELVEGHTFSVAKSSKKPCFPGLAARNYSTSMAQVRVPAYEMLSLTYPLGALSGTLALT
jgi:hypothetical protein